MCMTALAPHSSTLAWKIPWTEEPGGLQSMGLLKSQTWLSDFTFTFHFHALEKDMATHSRVLAWRIPGTREPGGLPSMGSHRVGHDWSHLAAAAAEFTVCGLGTQKSHFLTSNLQVSTIILTHQCQLKTLQEEHKYMQIFSTSLKWSESHSVLSDSLWPHGLCSPWNSPGQNSRVGSLSLLHGIFPTQGSNSVFPHCGWILYQLSYQGSLRIQHPSPNNDQYLLEKFDFLIFPQKVFLDTLILVGSQVSL